MLPRGLVLQESEALFLLSALTLPRVKGAGSLCCYGTRTCNASLC